MTDADPVVTCGERVSRCRCVKPAGHEDGVHACDVGCGGRWSGRGPDFKVVTFPTGNGTGLPSEDDPASYGVLPMRRGGIRFPTESFKWAELEDK